MEYQLRFILSLLCDFMESIDGETLTWEAVTFPRFSLKHGRRFLLRAFYRPDFVLGCQRVWAPAVKRCDRNTFPSWLASQGAQRQNSWDNLRKWV